MFFYARRDEMDVSIEKIIKAVEAVRQENTPDAVEPESLSPEEKKIMLILETAGFFGSKVSDESILSIRDSMEFILDNLADIYNRTTQTNSADEVKCPVCGVSVVSDAVFCHKCGNRIPLNKFSFLNKPVRKISNNFFESARIPGFEMMTTPVTQKTWMSVMDFNPSYFEDDGNPVDSVSWYDAIYFCNRLSEKYSYEPCYYFCGKSDVSAWGYKPGEDTALIDEPKCNFRANGFRLPTVSEWVTAASARENFVYSGSNAASDVAWFRYNSSDRTHEVRTKFPNLFGLYDMSGNVYEWCWDALDTERYFCGGCWKSQPSSCAINCLRTHDPSDRMKLFGFRVVRSV